MQTYKKPDKINSKEQIHLSLKFLILSGSHENKITIHR